MGFGHITHNAMNQLAASQKKYGKEVSTSKDGNVAKAGQSGLSQLTPGKVFAGEVISVSKDKVMLKLDNGQTIQAAANSDVNLVEGQKIAFMVKSNNGKQLAIKPMFEMQSNNSSVLKALQDAGVAVNSKNTELVQLLMSEQLPIDKDTINKFLRQMKIYPEVSAKTLVDLQKMGQPITQENIAKFESYQNHQYLLAGEIISTASEMAGFITEGVKAEGTAGLDAFSKMMDTIFAKKDDTMFSVDALKEHTKINGREPLKATYQDMPVLYDNLKSETMISQGRTGLTEIQQQALDNIDFMTGRYEGQELEMDHILEGMKILNDEAEVILNELKNNIENPLAKAGKGDVMTRLLAAFEIYETAEKSMAKAKTVLGGEEFKILSQETLKNEMAGKTDSFLGNAVLKGVLDESGRNVLAQKIYKVTGDISQYFQVRAGEMSPEEFVRMVNDMLPKEVTISETNGQTGESSKVVDNKMLQEGLNKTSDFKVVPEQVTTQENITKTGKVISVPEQVIVQENGVKSDGMINVPSQEMPQENVVKVDSMINISSQEVAQGSTMKSDGIINVLSQEVLQENITKPAGIINELGQELSQENAITPERFLSEQGKEVSQENISKSDKIMNVAEQVVSQESDVKSQESINNSINAEKPTTHLESTTRILNETMIEKLPELKDLMQCDEFREVLQKAVETKLLMNPEEVTKENIKAYYEKLDAQMEKLHEIVNEMGKQDSAVLKNTTSIKQNVDYMNQLNQLYSYVQIPLKLSSQNANSELYVMKNKKKSRDKDGTFTALLHLDMEKMGSIDVFITMEQKKIAVRFYLEKVSTAMFLEEHHKPFVEKLEEKGFQVTAEFEEKQKEKNMVEEFTKGEVESTFENKYSFDIRT